MGYTDAEKGEIYADVTELYRVGRVRIPAEAEALGGVTERLTDLIGSLNSRAAQMGDPEVAQNAMAVAGHVQEALRRTLTTMNDIAAGLVYVADEFVARDDYAREVFDGLGKGLTQGPVGQADVPGALDLDQLAHPGDGDDYAPVPDVRPPDEEYDDREGDVDDLTEDTPDPDGVIVP